MIRALIALSLGVAGGWAIASMCSYDIVCF